jgi:hypothetical protein
MKKALMFSAMAVGAIATMSSAQAKKGSEAYTFGTAGGSPYCNGITFAPSTYVSGAFEGIGTYNSVCSNYFTPSGFGGFEGSIKPLGAGKWYTFTGVPGGQGLPSNYILINYLNTKAATWYLAWEANATTYYSAIPFEILNSGELLPGAPSAKVPPEKAKYINKPNFTTAFAKIKASRKAGK